MGDLTLADEKLVRPGGAGWDLSCRDWKDRLAEGRSLIPTLPLDEARAKQAVGVFNKLSLPDVPLNEDGSLPTFRNNAGEWQRDLVRAAFGGYSGGRRMIPEMLLMTPKKAGKTTFGAGVSITAMLINQRPLAEFLYVGPRQEVADLAFSQASGMIRNDPMLRTRFHIAEHTKIIRDRVNGSRLKVKTFDMKVVTGSKPVFVLLDELHLMAKISEAQRVLGQIRGGLLPNAEGFLLMVTTQSDEPPSGVFKSELNYARRVRDGEIANARMLPVLYEFPLEMQRAGLWRDPNRWGMVNPNLGRTIQLAPLWGQYEESRQKGDAEERRWASQHLNVEIGQALPFDAWAGAEYWELRADEGLTLERILHRCDVVVVGVDGGGLDDLLGLTVVGRDKVTREWLSWSHAWAHASVLERRKEVAPKLRDFAEAGHLTLVKNATEDVEAIAAICKQIDDLDLLAQVGLDPVGIGAVVDALARVGIGGEGDTKSKSARVVGVTQGFKLSGSIKTVERKLADGTFRHAGQPLMAWCVGNAKTEQKGNALVVTKQVSGQAKIDPLVALFSAAALMSMNPSPPVPKVTIPANYRMSA